MIQLPEGFKDCTSLGNLQFFGTAWPFSCLSDEASNFKIEGGWLRAGCEILIKVEVTQKKWEFDQPTVKNICSIKEPWSQTHFIDTSRKWTFLCTISWLLIRILVHSSGWPSTLPMPKILGQHAFYAHVTLFTRVHYLLRTLNTFRAPHQLCGGSFHTCRFSTTLWSNGLVYVWLHFFILWP